MGRLRSMGREKVLELLHYYVDLCVIPGLLIGLVNIDSKECKVRIVPHESSLPKHLNLQFCIAIYQKTNFDPFLARQRRYHRLCICVHEGHEVAELSEVEDAEVWRGSSHGQGVAILDTVLRNVAEVDPSKAACMSTCQAFGELVIHHEGLVRSVSKTILFESFSKEACIWHINLLLPRSKYLIE